MQNGGYTFAEPGKFSVVTLVSKGISKSKSHESFDICTKKPMEKWEDNFERIVR